MILPRAEDRAVVVFHVWPSLAYTTRLNAGFILMLAGLAVQFFTSSVLPGVLLLAAGNLLLLVRGYDNRVDYAKFDPAATWERVDAEKLAELRELDRRIRSWDTTALDVTNPLGATLFVVIVVISGFLAWFTRGPVQILVIDAMVLFLPHWLTGIRSVLVLPKLMVRVDRIQEVLRSCERPLADHRTQLLMLLHGDETRVPEDVKFKIDIAGSPDDFLGLYGQVVLNEVQGSSYPYFYVVLVARRGYGLGELASAYSPPRNLVCEFDLQQKVEVMVIRQFTTKTSGYHTKLDASVQILLEGLKVARRAGSKTPAAGSG